MDVRMLVRSMIIAEAVASSYEKTIILQVKQVTVYCITMALIELTYNMIIQMTVQLVIRATLHRNT